LQCWWTRVGKGSSWERIFWFVCFLFVSWVLCAP
jgi:hypothetical protein